MVWIHKRRKGEGKQLYVKGARQKEKFYSRSCFFDIFFSTWPRVKLFFLPGPLTESCFPSPLLLLWISTICCSTILTELNWVDQDLSEDIVTKQMLPGMVKVSLLLSLKFSVIFSATWLSLWKNLAQCPRRTIGILWHLTKPIFFHKSLHLQLRHHITTTSLYVPQGSSPQQ